MERGGGGNYGDIIYLIGEHESLSSYTAGRRRTGRDGFLFHRQTDPWRGGRSGPRTFPCPEIQTETMFSHGILLSQSERTKGHIIMHSQEAARITYRQFVQRNIFYDALLLNIKISAL